MSLSHKWEVKTLRLSDLKVSDKNPRTITDKKFLGLVNSIRRFGLVEPIVWNERTGRIVGGHQRYRVLLEMGITEAPVIVVNLSEERERAANLTLNNPEIEGEFDDPIVELLKHLQEENKDLFKELNFEPLQKALEAAASRNAVDFSDNESSGFKTKCPCCNHEWEVTVNDVSVEKGE